MNPPAWILDWTHPVVAGPGALAVGAVVFALTLRHLRGPVRSAVRASAVARAGAAALAVLAAAGPVRVTREAVFGDRLLASPRRGPSGEVERRIEWPADVPGPAPALEVLRAARTPDLPAALVLASRGSLVRASDGALLRGLEGGDGIRPAVLPLPSPEPASALATAPRLVIPTAATAGVPTALELDGGALPFAREVAVVQVGGRRIEQVLPAGETRVRLEPVMLEAGTHVVVVRVPGRLPAAAVLTVSGAPRVLLVGRPGGTSGPLAEALSAQGIDVVVAATRSGISDALDHVAAVILGPGTGRAGAEQTSRRVRQGAGLLVLGGPEESGLRRLAGTALEPLLPIRLPPPKPPKPPDPEPPTPAPKPKPPPKKDPDAPRAELDEGNKQALRVALLICLDRSGSMAGPKLRLAQEAAMAAARNLSPEDRIGVIAFDDSAQWVAPFQNARSLGTLLQRVRGITAEGGTNFYPALKMGFDRILKQPCGIRHVVLLTDGVTRAAVFGDLVSGGAQQGVTLSTVAVGDGADTHLLGLLAGWGRGKLYLAVDPRRLPEIITIDTRSFVALERENRKRELAEQPDEIPAPPQGPQDTETATTTDQDPPEPTKAPEGPVVAPRSPLTAAPAPCLAGLEGVAWPPLPHPEDPTARTASHVPLRWRNGGPALALGRAGLGRVAVLAADLTTEGAADFWAWEHGGAFVAQLLRSLVHRPPTEPAGVTVVLAPLDDGSGFVRVDARGSGVLHLEEEGGGRTLRIPCEARSGFALGSLAVMPAAGLLTGRWEPLRGDPARAVAVSGGPRPPGGTAAVRRVAQAGDTPIVTDLPQRPQGPPRERREPVDAWFLLAAAGLLVVEAAARRIARG